MSFTIKRTKATFDPPPEGTFNAVLVDVVDLGMVVVPRREDKEGKPVIEDSLELRWEIEETNPKTGARFVVRSKRLKKSTFPTSNFRKTVESWRGGRKIDEAELERFETSGVDHLIGEPAMLQIVHVERTSGDGIFANISAILAPLKDMKPLKPSNKYQREPARTKPSGGDSAVPF